MALSRTEARGHTDAAAALARTLDLLKRRGLLVIISDLYDEAKASSSALKQAAHIGHETILFHVLTRDEVELPFRDDVELEDPETGRIVLSNGAAAARRTGKRSAGSSSAGARAAATYGVDYVRVFTDTPLDAALRAYLRRRVLGGAA